MRKLIQAMVGVGAMILSSQLLAQNPDTVCHNLKLMITQQQQTLAHYQQEKSPSHNEVQQSRHDLKKYQHAVAHSQAEVKQLRQQLSIEQAKLDHAEHIMKSEHRRFVQSTKNLKTYTEQVMYDERELIQSLDKQYQQMCSLQADESKDTKKLTPHHR